MNEKLELPTQALSTSARRTLAELAEASDVTVVRSAASSLPASHFARIYGQRGQHHPSPAMSTILGEVASNLRDFAETPVALLSLEDASSWYLLFVEADEHSLAGFYYPKPEQNVPNVVREFARGIPELQRVVERSAEEWLPDTVPATVLLAELGRTFVDNATPRLATWVFERVENVLRDGTSPQKDAIATGFLEGVVSAVDRDAAAGWVLAKAGPAAKAYIEAWNRFCGVEV